eukprot:366475-Chlamydomonas_euryale.AAC.1
MDPASATALMGLATLPWMVKPLYGFISDSVPLLGYRRRSYLAACGLLGEATGIRLRVQGLGSRGQAVEGTGFRAEGPSGRGYRVEGRGAKRSRVQGLGPRGQAVEAPQSRGAKRSWSQAADGPSGRGAAESWSQAVEEPKGVRGSQGGDTPKWSKGAKKSKGRCSDGGQRGTRKESASCESASCESAFRESASRESACCKLGGGQWPALHVGERRRV